jgi:hypothetical protein
MRISRFAVLSVSVGIISQVRLKHRYRRRQFGEREPADFAIELLAIEPRARDAPVARCELEVAASRPMRQHAEDVAQVDLWIELVQSSRPARAFYEIDRKVPT